MDKVCRADHAVCDYLGDTFWRAMVKLSAVVRLWGAGGRGHQIDSISRRPVACLGSDNGTCSERQFPGSKLAVAVCTQTKDWPYEAAAQWMP